MQGSGSGAAAAVDANKRAVAITSACLLCLVPWLQVGRRDAATRCWSLQQDHLYALN